MKVNSKTNAELTNNNSKIEEVSEFTYLGDKIKSGVDSTSEIESNIIKIKIFKSNTLAWSPSVWIRTF